MEYLLFLAICFEIFLLIYVANRSNRGQKFLLYILSAHWSFSFVIRPLIFLYCRSHQVDNYIYDDRIGLNNSILLSILSLIFVGCGAFSLMLIVLSRKNGFRSAEAFRIENFDEFLQTVVFGFTVGFLSLLIENTDYKNPFSKSLTPLITLSFCTYLWMRKKGSISRTKDIVIIGIGTLGTFLMSVSLQNSKGVLLLPSLVYISTLQVWKSKDAKLSKFLMMILIVISTIPFFSTLQLRKLGETGLMGATAHGEKLPWYLSPFLLIAERFDQFARITDSRLAAPNSLGGFNSLAKSILQNLEWNPSSGRTEVSFGQQWNLLVTNQTIPGAKMSQVSLSQGMIAEGYIWAGLGSMILECLAIACIFFWVGKLLDGNSIKILFAFGLLQNGSIFESGLVSFAASLSGALKIVLFIWLYKIISRINGSLISGYR